MITDSSFHLSFIQSIITSLSLVFRSSNFQIISQVFEPLRAMIMSAPLEDARLLTYRYERIRQDLESQVIL